MPRMPRVPGFPSLQEIPEIPETETVRFLETFILEKQMGFSKKAWILFKIAKRGNFSVECVSNGFISQTCLPCYSRSFLAK